MPPYEAYDAAVGIYGKEVCDELSLMILCDAIEEHDEASKDTLRVFLNWVLDTTPAT